MVAGAPDGNLVDHKDGGLNAAQEKKGGQNYKGFVAGVFSGIAKLSGEF